MDDPADVAEHRVGDQALVRPGAGIAVPVIAEPVHVRDHPLVAAVTQVVPIRAGLTVVEPQQVQRRGGAEHHAAGVSAIGAERNADAEALAVEGGAFPEAGDLHAGRPQQQPAARTALAADVHEADVARQRQVEPELRAGHQRRLVG